MSIEILKINSSKGAVKFSEFDLAEYDLLKYVRTSFRGIGKKGLIEQTPFERIAAKLFKEEYPSDHIKIAEKCILNDDNSVLVVLRIANDVSSGFYNKHKNVVVYKKNEQQV